MHLAPNVGVIRTNMSVCLSVCISPNDPAQLEYNHKITAFNVYLGRETKGLFGVGVLIYWGGGGHFKLSKVEVNPACPTRFSVPSTGSVQQFSHRLIQAL